MNKYYCTKCDAVSVIYSSVPEMNATCSCVPEPVLHRLVSLKGKPTPPAPKKAVEVAPEPIVEAPKPQTKLDVSSGPVKGAK